MSRNFPAHQAEAMAQLHTSRIIPNIRHTQTNKADDDTEQPERNTQEGILKNTLTKNNAPSHVRHFNMSDELYNAMEEQRLEACLDISDQDPTSYEKKRTLTFI